MKTFKNTLFLDFIEYIPRKQYLNFAALGAQMIITKVQKLEGWLIRSDSGGGRSDFMLPM